MKLCKDCGISHSVLTHWIKQDSHVRLDNDTVMTAKQIQELQTKRK